MTSPLRRVVTDAFFAFNARHEAVVDHLYPDSKNLVTAGVGNLADPVALALTLPLRRADGALASADEIRADWHAVKNLPDGPRLGAPAAAKVVKLHMTRADIEALVALRRDANARALGRRFPDFASWPAPAQMAVMSLAWAAGTSFDFPLCAAALARGDFRAAAEEVAIDEQKTKGVHRRNLANRNLLLAAARCQAEGGDPDALDLTPPAETNEAPSVPPPGPSPEALAAHALAQQTTSEQVNVAIRESYGSDR